MTSFALSDYQNENVMKISFNDPNLLEWLDAEADYDCLSFGVIKMDYNGMVTEYNRAQFDLTGVAAENAVGKHFFTQVAPCTNNFMVAEKYRQGILDESLPYIFTYITKPTKVELRLIKGRKGNQYLLAQAPQND